MKSLKFNGLKLLEPQTANSSVISTPPLQFLGNYLIINILQTFFQSFHLQKDAILHCGLPSGTRFAFHFI